MRERQFIRGWMARHEVAIAPKKSRVAGEEEAILLQGILVRTCLPTAYLRAVRSTF